MDIIAEVPVGKLLHLCPIFKFPIWGDILHRKEIINAIRYRRFYNRSHKNTAQWSMGQHIARCARLAVTDFVTWRPIEIDVGSEDWVIIDGNHRFAALAATTNYLQRPKILAHVVGDDEVVNRLLGYLWPITLGEKPC